MSVAITCDGIGCGAVGPSAWRSDVKVRSDAQAEGWGTGRVVRQEGSWQTTSAVDLCPACLPTNGGHPGKNGRGSSESAVVNDVPVKES